MDKKLVTCVYNGLHRTKLHGRLNRDRPYTYSLECIVDSGSDIVCYTSPQELHDMHKHFITDLGKNNIQFKTKDLTELYFHEQVDVIRDFDEAKYRQSTEWRDRCVEIMWGKFLFIKEVIQENPSLKNVFWIDAGISHPGIIHSRFNPNYEHNIDFVWDLNKETYHTTFRNDLIFNNKFVDHLIDYTGEGHVLNIAAVGPQHQRLSHDAPFKGSVIGGLFGGNASVVNDYCDKVIEYFQHFANDNILCKEEQIMTEILAKDLFPIKIFKFQTWYHPDWGHRYSPDQISFCDFFDEIEKQ